MIGIALTAIFYMRCVIGALFAGIFVVASVGNLGLFLVWYFVDRRELTGVHGDLMLPKRHLDLIPDLGGVFGAIAFVLFPWGSLHYLFWLPLLLDIGCVPFFFLSVGVVVRQHFYYGRDLE